MSSLKKRIIEQSEEDEEEEVRSTKRQKSKQIQTESLEKKQHESSAPNVSATQERIDRRELRKKYRNLIQSTSGLLLKILKIFKNN